MSPIPATIDDTLGLLRRAGYVAGRDLATVAFLSLRMGRPLFLEGEAGVGKTEIAKVVSSALGRELIRLQCYEGLDIAQAAYEWNYSRQLIAVRAAGDATGMLLRLADVEELDLGLLDPLEGPVLDDRLDGRDEGGEAGRRRSDREHREELDAVEQGQDPVPARERPAPRSVDRGGGHRCGLSVAGASARF